MKISTMKGLAAGGMLGVTLGASMMMMPQGRKMKRVIAKGGAHLIRQVADCWLQ